MTENAKQPAAKVSTNGIVAWWMHTWGDFQSKHCAGKVGLSDLLLLRVQHGCHHRAVLIFTFMPYLLGKDLAGTEFMWPQVNMSLFGVDFTWSLLGYNVVRDAAGAVVIGGGWATSLAMRWARSSPSALTSRCSAISPSRAMAIRCIRQCGTSLLGGYLADLQWLQ